MNPWCHWEFSIHGLLPFELNLTFSLKVQFVAILIKLIYNRPFLILFNDVIKIELNEIFPSLLSIVYNVTFASY